MKTAESSSDSAAAEVAPAFPYDRWMAQLPALRSAFRSNQPFPHVVLDDVLEADVVSQVDRDFPPTESPAWIYYKHYNESTLGKSDLAEIPESIQQLLQELLSERFCRFLSELTGIEGLVGDPTLEGGGLHLTEPGGFLRVHTDFTHHNRRPELRRRCNFILYLNRQWQDEWGGSLELWDRSLENCVQRYLPIFNRALIFETTDISFHGYPLPICPPKGITRRSITSYYYTHDTDPASSPRATHYVVRPGEKSNRVLVQLDNLLVGLYARIKRMTGLSDELTGKFLSLFKRRSNR